MRITFLGLPVEPVEPVEFRKISDFIFPGKRANGKRNKALNPNHVSILKLQFCRLFYNIQAGQIRIVEIYTISDKLNFMAWKNTTAINRSDRPLKIRKRPAKKLCKLLPKKCRLKNHRTTTDKITGILN
jgi:hypothetical protein